MPITVFVNGVTTIRVTLPEARVVRVMPAPMVGPQGPPGPIGPVGPQGNGIASTVDNGDGTFTIIYDDGTDFTTDDLTGPQGPPGQDGDGVAYYGEISRVSSGVVNIPTAGVYFGMPLTPVLDPLNNGVGLGILDDFSIKNTSGETVLFKIYASTDVEASNNKVLGIKLALNGTTIDETECNAPTGSASSFAKLVTNWMIELAPDDEVALYITNFSNSGDVTVLRARMVASTVGRQGAQGPAGEIEQVTNVIVDQTGWTFDSGLWYYDITDSNILSDSIVDIIPSNADYPIVAAAQLLPESVSSTGEVRIFAVNEPTDDFSVTLNIFN